MAQRLVAAPEVTADVTDAHLQGLAVNVGLALAILVSALLYMLYQSLGRLLEKHVFTPDRRLWRARVGMFYVIAVSSALPPAVVSALAGQVTLRGNWWFYAWVVGVGTAAPFLFRGGWANVDMGRKVILFVAAITFSLMGTLI
ncbi:hypothetical protein [Cellulomonas hominis]